MQDITRIAEGVKLTPEVFGEFLKKHDRQLKRYKKLAKAYDNDYPIYRITAQEQLEYWKPHNKISVNFARYITDSFEGFFCGIPIKTTSQDEKISEYINYFDSLNDQDDKNAELSRLTSIYGRSFGMEYVGEDGEIHTAYMPPTEADIIYSDGITPEPLYFWHDYIDVTDNTRRGSISDDTYVWYWYIDKDTGNVVYEQDSYKIHGFNGVPAEEYILNSMRKGIFEDVLPLINAGNKVISEKADNVEYFADAYMKVLGAPLDEETTHFIRRNRIINFPGTDGQNPDIGFLEKPNADNTEENLLDRLQKLIFTVAMVVNTQDEAFGTQSGEALKWKTFNMTNLARVKERKFTMALNHRYRHVFSNPLSGQNPRDWYKIDYKFTFSSPVNITDEVNAVKSLEGIVSKKTQLSLLSFVENVDEELAQIEKEQMGNSDIYSTERVNNE